MKHYGDITKLSGYELPAVDIITGGSPCQDLSVAGKRAGLAGERSGLFMEQMRIIKELRERDRESGRTAWTVRPRYMVWENVPGAFSSGTPKGADFAAGIEEIIKVAEPGASVDVCVPDRGWTKSGCYYAEDGSWSIAWRVHDAQFWGVPQRRKRIALVADFGGLSAPEILFERTGLSWDSEPGGAQGEGTAGGAESGTGSAEPMLLESNQNHATIQTDGISTALPASMGMGGGYVPMVANTLSARYDGSPKPDKWNGANIVCAAFKAGNGAQAQSIGYEEEKAPTLSAAPSGTNQVPAVYDARGNGDSTKANLTIAGSTVRRLTPLECERLQGYPDNWTDIGEWTDSKGKKHKDADSPRYKALGNSIALPFWAWMARRICAQYERPMTMASLFDGIGGFPLVFSRAGAVPVWASEIEEFPIAVTKLRFPEVEP